MSLTDRRAMTFDEILTGHNYSRQRKYVGPYCSIYIAGICTMAVFDITKQPVMTRRIYFFQVTTIQLVL